MTKAPDAIRVSAMPIARLLESASTLADACVILCLDHGQAQPDLSILGDINVLVARFDDEDDPAHPGAITDETARRIASFTTAQLRNHATCGRFDIIVACRGGMCRSAGAACAIDAMLHGDEHAAERFLTQGRFLPNRLVFDKCTRAFDTEDKLENRSWWNGRFEENAREWDRRNL